MGNAEDIALFTWHRRQAGFGWVRSRAVTIAHPQDFLVPLDDSRPRPVTFYEPLVEERALFRQFGECEPTKAGILAFANQFGELGADRAMLSGRSGPVQWGDSISTWIQAIVKMRNAVDVWDAITADDYGLLREWFRVQQPEPPILGGAIFERDGGLHNFVSEREELWEHVQGADTQNPAELVRIARFFLQKSTNVGLKDASPRLLFNPATDSHELHIVPRNLLGAMWMQFSRAFEGNKGYRRCQQCKQWIEVSTEGHRSHTVYCGDTCRVRAHRAKKAKARRLAADGVPIREVARRLNTTAKAVRGWIKAG